MNFTNLVEYFSHARIAPYASSGLSPQEVLWHYHENIRLSEALIPSLHYLEIGLRNRLNQLFCRHYDPIWLLRLPPPLMMSPEDERKIRHIQERVQREKKRLATQGDIVSQMTFGFWYSFFHRKYDPVIWHRKEAILSVFPNLLRAHRTRSHIEKKLIKIKEIRNRVAHYEPIATPKTHIDSVHDMCQEIIQAMSSDAAKLLREIDRFSQVRKGILSPAEAA